MFSMHGITDDFTRLDRQGRSRGLAGISSPIIRQLAWELGGCLWFGILGVILWAPQQAGAALPITTQRQVVLAAMQARPDDPWPRSQGHAMLAWPGSPENLKAYHEPGGSFSPAMGSFGISFWVTDEAGSIVATSDQFPTNQIQQSWRFANPRTIPAIATETPYYHATWSGIVPGTWNLQFQSKTNANARYWLVIRSVGPAGAPIPALEWNGRQLTVSSRWVITSDQPLTLHALGHEGDSGWTKSQNQNRQWRAADGWCFARLSLPVSPDAKIQVRDLGPIPPPSLVLSTVQPRLELSLPDERFAACLNAQVSQILMSLAGRETRSGDPAYFPVCSLRDGAYIVSALAGAGVFDAARQLATGLVERDFFGPTGSDADAPGLAIWAISELTSRLRDPALDQLVWPSVARKAALIQEMQSATWPIFKRAGSPVFPKHARRPDIELVCEPSDGRSIMGKVEWKRPVLYNNSVAYLGYLRAAEMAFRVGDPLSAQNWRNLAAELRQGWQAGIQMPAAIEPRTYSFSLWPAGIPANLDSFVYNLQSRWTQARDAQGKFRAHPFWPSMDLAETHQWLLLGRPQFAMSTVEWFWKNQASPGLYTWWEGDGEDDVFPFWQRCRGWVKPDLITPHYGVAAQMVLLQLDILAYVDERGPEPVLVVGAGIPTQWIEKPLRVRGLATRAGLVEWAWANGVMKVNILGKRIPVRLGANFPPNAMIRLF